MFNKNESSLVKLFFSTYSKSQSFLDFSNIFFPLFPIKKIKFLYFEKSRDDWDLEYIEKKSLTNEDSFLLNIKKITKKNKKRYKKN